jgi:hypothetical protein
VERKNGKAPEKVAERLTDISDILPASNGKPRILLPKERTAPCREKHSAQRGKKREI